MENIEEFKKRIRESIVGGMSQTFGGVGSVQEKTDVKVDQLAGAVIAAGPQKAGDAIAKMDPNAFAEFAKKIDAAGLAMLTQQFANGAGGAAPAADPAAPPADLAAAGGAPAPVAAPTEPELTDL
jgi:hypothetical protein